MKLNRNRYYQFRTALYVGAHTLLLLCAGVGISNVRAQTASPRIVNPNIPIIQDDPWPIDTTFNLFPVTRCKFTVTIKAAKNPCPPMLVIEGKDVRPADLPVGCCCYDITIQNNTPDISICQFSFDFADDLSHVCNACNFPVGWSDNSFTDPYIIQTLDPTKGLGPGQSKTFTICARNQSDFVSCTATATECNGYEYCQVQSNVVPASSMCVKAFTPSGNNETDFAQFLAIQIPYPNPANGVIAFNCRQHRSGELRVVVSDMKGDNVASTNWLKPGNSSYKIEINTRDLPESDYIATFTFQGLTVSRKFSVHH